jgi:hypothetical protein
MALPITISLKDAVKRLADHNLGAKLLILGDYLVLVAELTRWNFNDGRPLEVLHINVVKDGVLHSDLDGAIDRHHARMNSGIYGPSEIPAIDVYSRHFPDTVDPSHGVKTVPGRLPR